MSGIVLARAGVAARKRSTTALLSDTFSGASWDATKWTLAGNSTTSVVSGAGRWSSINATPFYGAATAKISAVANVGLLTQFRYDGNDQVARFYLRQTGSLSPYGELSTTASGYVLELDLKSSTWILWKSVNNVGTTYGTVTRTFSAATLYWARLEAVGGTVRARVWADGAAEPTTWQASGTDASPLAANAVVLTSSNYAGGSGWTFDLDNISVYPAT